MRNSWMQKKDKKATYYDFIDTKNLLKKRVSSKSFETIVIEGFLENRIKMNVKAEDLLYVNCVKMS